MTHTTKGIVLRCVKYGETSIIATVYTELFGIQSYMVKGIRKGTKKSPSKANYFQPAAILEMEVYHNELKNIQFIKEYEWAVLYERIFFDVIRNAAASFITELLLHCLKQPEPDPQLFYLAEECLLAADKESDTIAANISLYYILHFAMFSGFRMQGVYNADTPILDLTEGIFIHDIPAHNEYLKDDEARFTYEIYNTENIQALEHIALNKSMRRHLLISYLKYLSLHIPDMGELKTISVLNEVL